MQDDGLAKNRNFSLYPEQEAVLVQVAKDNGLGSVSAALRFVVTDWVRLRAEKDGFQVLNVQAVEAAV